MVGIAATALVLTVPVVARASTCIQSNRIDHTEIPDDGHILFHMLDRSVYRATMQGRCYGLQNETRGFTYEPIPGSNEICSNLLTIRLNTNQSICLVGEITLIEPRPHH